MTDSKPLAPGLSAPQLLMDAEITINERTYQLAKLPLEVRDLIYFYQTWERELADQKIAMMKTDAAMRTISVEITTRLRSLDEQDPTLSKPVA